MTSNPSHESERRQNEPEALANQPVSHSSGCFGSADREWLLHGCYLANELGHCDKSVATESLASEQRNGHLGVCADDLPFVVISAVN